MGNEYLKITGFRIERVKSPKKYSMKTPHYHYAYEIFIPIEGQITLLIGDEIIASDNSGIVLTNKELPHGNYSRSEHERTVIYFDDEFLDMFLTTEGKETIVKMFSEKKLVAPSRDELKRARLILEKLEKIPVVKGNLGEIFFLLFDFLLILKNSPEGKKQVSRVVNSTLGSAIAYITMNYDKIESVKDISDAFYISESYLCRLFKEGMGLTVSEYINSVRINSACEKLKYTKKSASEICFEVGYKSYTYFCRNFQKIIGETPYQYAKKMKSTEK